MYDTPENTADPGAETHLSDAAEPAVTPEDRRAEADRERRRRNDRRRSSKGLLELRARRDGVDADRRAQERRDRRAQRWQRLPLFSWFSRRIKSSS